MYSRDQLAQDFRKLGISPGDTVMATRKEIFPLYGLDPWFD